MLSCFKRCCLLHFSQIEHFPKLYCVQICDGLFRKGQQIVVMLKTQPSGPVPKSCIFRGQTDMVPMGNAKKSVDLISFFMPIGAPGWIFPA